MKRKTYSEDFKRKSIVLANEVGNSNAAKELGVSGSSISNWRKALISKVPTKNYKGVFTFNLDNHTYSLEVNSEEERNSILEQINSHSKHS